MSTDARMSSPSALGKPGVLADEAALKRLFDAEFEASVAAAKAQLGDAPGLASRVVETTFLSLWNQRATIATQEQLKTLLTDEIRHGTARALSRRASAGRFAGGKSSGVNPAAAATASAVDVWASIQKTLHATAAGHAAHDRVSRHDTASHMKQMSAKKSLVGPAILLVVALAVAVGGVMYISSLGVDDAAVAAVSSQSLQPFVTSNPGQTGTFTLPDSTRVRIGPETKLFVPDNFPAKVRAVRLEGTAQFDPPAGGAQPFRVIAKRNHVVATGTSFAVSAFPGDSAVYVLVKEGSVRVKTLKAEATLAANQAMLLDRGTTREATADERALSFSWLDGHVTVPPMQLRHVVKQLARWFSVDVKVVDMPLLDREASFDVPLNETAAAITAVEKTANLRSTNEGGGRVFRDATPPTKKKK